MYSHFGSQFVADRIVDTDRFDYGRDVRMWWNVLRVLEFEL